MPRPPARRTRHPPYLYWRRRLVALAAVGAAGAFLALAVSSLVGEDEAPDEEAGPVGPEPRIPVETLVGQRLMVRMEARATRTLVRAARRGEIAGVIVFPPGGVDAAAIGREIARLQRAAADGGQPPLLVATDQEGGEVKRFLDGPPDEAPLALGEEGADAARAAGQETGAYLADLGINVDLAPVLDVAWTPDSVIAARSFGANAEAVTEPGVAFAEGLGSAGVIATAKHFPGLGRTAVNTDVAPVQIDAARADLERDLEPFRAAVEAGVPMIMLSNATYAALDRQAPATWSRPIISDLLREDVGFEGVVVTDDLGAGAVTAQLPAPRAAVRSAEAGADLLLLANQESPDDAFGELLAAARRGALDRDGLEESYGRVIELKNDLGF